MQLTSPSFSPIPAFDLAVQPETLSFDDALQRFETLYMASRNLAPNTRVEYRNDLTQLRDFLAGHGTVHPAHVSLPHLQAYLARLDARGYAGTSRRRKTSSMRAFFGFLTNAGLLARDPSLQLRPPAREHREPRFLSTQEYRALLRACAHETRDAALIELLLQTGIRLSEAAGLMLHDVALPARINQDPANTGSITVEGKGRKRRTLPLNYKACRALKAWLAVRPEIPEAALFVTKFRRPMGPCAIQRMVAKYLAEAGIQGASVHTLRHTFGTQHVARGTNLRTVQEALGHSDLKTTSIYVSMAKDAMRRDLQRNAL